MQRADLDHVVIPHAYQMHLRSHFHIRAADVTVERQTPFALGIRFDVRRMGDILVSIDDHVRMRISPYQRTVLHPTEQQRQLLHLVLQVLAIDDAAEVKHLRAVVYLRPETMLQQLLRLAQILHGAELIEVGEYSHDLREAVCLHHVQKFEGFHLEAVLGIDAKQYQIGDLGNVEHCRGRIRTFQ